MTFQDDITKFNSMYRMPAPDVLQLEQEGGTVNRLLNFGKIVREELEEADEIVAALNGGKAPIEVLTMLADWFGDIIVYAASEMTKYGIPVEKTLEIIMQSNFSKMGADGKPIFDERGKLQKGPGYWKPEPKIREMLENVG